MSTDTAPRTQQKNYRLPVELAERLDAKADELDVNAVDIVIEGLERELRRLGRGGELKLIARARPSKRKRHRRSEEANGVGQGGSARERGDRASTAAAGERSPTVAPAVPSVVHLPTVLSTWTGMPKAIMERAVASGQVTVDGAVVTELDVPRPDRAVVRWNGEPV
jgi:hypothetical protein